MSPAPTISYEDCCNVTDTTDIETVFFSSVSNVHGILCALRGPLFFAIALDEILQNQITMNGRYVITNPVYIIGSAEFVISFERKSMDKYDTHFNRNSLYSRRK